MHILNLGILQNVCAEGILWLMEHNVFCDGITAAADKLRLVFNEFRGIAKFMVFPAPKEPSRQQTFTMPPAPTSKLTTPSFRRKPTSVEWCWPGLQTVGWHYEPSFMLIGPRPKTP